jgi:hypothetical protein
MSTLNRDVLKINDRLFLIKRILKEEQCKDVELLKVWADADIVFKKENMMFFCESIVDLEIESENN